MWAKQDVHVQNSEKTRPFLGRSLKAPLQSSAANEFQFDPLTGCPGAAPNKSMFKDQVNITYLNQHVKNMLDSGWRFNPIQCSAAAALTRPNSTGSLTKDEFHWIKGIKVSRSSEEKSMTQKEEALAKEHIAREMNRGSDGDDEPLDDASLKTVLDEFYDGMKYGPYGTSTGMTIDDAYDSNVAMSYEWSNFSAKPFPTEHSFGTDMRIHKPFTNSNINVEGAFSDELTKELPSAPSFQIENMSGSDQYVQNLYSDLFSIPYPNFNGPEDYSLDSPNDFEALAALKPKESYKMNEHPATLGIKDTYDEKLHKAVEHESNIMREIIEANPDKYNPAEYWMPNMSLVSSDARVYPPVQRGQTSTDSPDRSAAVGNQLLADLQASAIPLTPRTSFRSCSLSLPQSEKSVSSPDVVASSSPIKFNPDLPLGGKAPLNPTCVNLLPEYDSDSGAENSCNSRQVTPTPSYRGAPKLGRHITDNPAHQNAQCTDHGRTKLAFPTPIMRPSTPVHMNTISSNEHRDGSAASPTRPYFPSWISTPGSSSPSPPKRFALPKSVFRGKILTTPTKQSSAPIPWLVPTNTGPHPPVASMYPEQYRRMGPTNTRREVTGKKVATKGKSNAGKRQRVANGEQSAEGGPAPKKRRTQYTVEDVRRLYERCD